MPIASIKRIFKPSSCAVLLFLVAWFARIPNVEAQAPVPSSNAALTTALTSHGGAALRTISRLRLEGQSASVRGTMRVVISAELNGNMRIDYGDPVTRSLINTATGSTEIVSGRASRKPPHVGLFAQLDMLSIFGLLRLDTANVAWSDLGPTTVGGRAALSRRADTGQSKEQYHRILRDQTDIRFDQQTGLVSSITRVHYGEKSLDLALPVTLVFLDYRLVNNIALPFRIERYLGSSLVEAITITNVELNASFPAGIFAR